MYYRLDIRALSLMRIAIALIINIDLLIRFSDLEAHYTNNGLWPLNLIYNFGWNPGFWSLHALNGGVNYILILFVLHFIFALFLLIGYKTRLFSVLVWLFTISLHNRNLFVLQAGDDLLRMILFWGIFLPWGNYYSIDSKKITLLKNNALANIGYLLLIASIYFFTFNLKNSAEWRNSGTAIYFALSLDQLRMPFFGDWLYQFPILMNILTHFVYWIEFVLPFLILWPSKNGKSRFIAFILILILQIGIGMTLYVGLFFLINIASSIGLIPSIKFNFNRSRIKQNTFIYQKPIKQNYFLKISSNLIAVYVIVICIIINLSSVNWFNYQLKSEFTYSVNLFRLNQFWGMFSPKVLKNDGWFVYHGIDSLGQSWDLRMNEKNINYSKPKHIVSLYKNDRWRKLAENMQNPKYNFLRPQFGKNILLLWNIENPKKNMVTLNLYFMEKENLLNYQNTQIKKILYCVCTKN